jgi:PhzF family phenazine biosynthesis protein
MLKLFTMTSYPIYQVDAFTSKPFGGNPAAVCPLQTWLPDALMQQLAAENNLSETAFFVEQNGRFYIRWFTPEFEIDLCGHATLASAFVIFNHLNYNSDTIFFDCKSGELVVKKVGDKIELNFPSRMPVSVDDIPENLLKGLSIAPAKVLKSRDYFLVYDDEKYVHDLQVDYQFLNQLDVVGVIVTAPGRTVDFVSRFFVPNSVIGEDPVTGSAHCNLIPYWSQVLNKTDLVCRQVSARMGELWCQHVGDRVTMAGYGVLYMKGEYYLP